MTFPSNDQILAYVAGIVSALTPLAIWWIKRLIVKSHVDEELARMKTIAEIAEKSNTKIESLEQLRDVLQKIKHPTKHSVELANTPPPTTSTTTTTTTTPQPTAPDAYDRSAVESLTQALIYRTWMVLMLNQKHAQDRLPGAVETTFITTVELAAYVEAARQQGFDLSPVDVVVKFLAMLVANPVMKELLDIGRTIYADMDTVPLTDVMGELQRRWVAAGKDLSALNQPWDSLSS